jgi:hypothetical protein
MANHLAKARDDWRADQAYRAKKEKEAKDLYLAGAKECLARIEKLRGIKAKKDLAEWFDRCRLWLLLTKNDQQAKRLANRKREQISSASRALLKALDETALDVLAELLGSYDAADEFFVTLYAIRKKTTRTRRRGPQRDKVRTLLGKDFWAVFKAHNIKFTAYASDTYGGMSLAVKCLMVGLQIASPGTARKFVQELAKEMGKSEHRFQR